MTEEGVRAAAVLVREERILDVVAHDEIPDVYEIEDAGDLVVMPGLVDTHVHINEPGRTDWEGFETATKAAAAGGVTTIIDMPLNCIPATTTLAALDEKVIASEKNLWVDCGFYGGLVPRGASRIGSLAESGVFGIKVFLIDSGVPEFPASGEAELRAAMPVLAGAGLPLLVHAELSNTATLRSGDPRKYRTYLSSRPRAWENNAIDLVLRLGRECGCPVHIVHLSSSDAVSMLRDAKEAGHAVTVETCPHYLYLCAEDISDGQTLAKCAPPIRERENRELLWEALDEGVIDFVVTDHSPSPPAMKNLDAGDFVTAWGGIASLQLSLPVTWTAAKKRGFALDDLAGWMCRGPASFAGLDHERGSIKPSAFADLVVWDPDESFVVERSTIRHRHPLTPYEGHTLFGVVKKTFLRGHCVFDGAVSMDSPIGKVLRRGSR